MLKLAFAILFLLQCVSLVNAVDPADVFTDGTVLQCEEPVRIWGTAKPDEVVTVSFAGQSVETRADENGDWLVTLKPLEANATGREI